MLSIRTVNNTIINDCNATAVIFDSSLNNKISDIENVVIKISFKVEDLNNTSDTDFFRSTNLIDTDTGVGPGADSGSL